MNKISTHNLSHYLTHFWSVSRSDQSKMSNMDKKGICPFYRLGNLYEAVPFWTPLLSIISIIKNRFQNRCNSVNIDFEVLVFDLFLKLFDSFLNHFSFYP